MGNRNAPSLAGNGPVRDLVVARGKDEQQFTTTKTGHYVVFSTGKINNYKKSQRIGNNEGFHR